MLCSRCHISKTVENLDMKIGPQIGSIGPFLRILQPFKVLDIDFEFYAYVQKLSGPNGLLMVTSIK